MWSRVVQKFVGLCCIAIAFALSMLAVLILLCCLRSSSFLFVPPSLICYDSSSRCLSLELSFSRRSLLFSSFLLCSHAPSVCVRVCLLLVWASVDLYASRFSRSSLVLRPTSSLPCHPSRSPLRPLFQPSANQSDLEIDVTTPANAEVPEASQCNC